MQFLLSVTISTATPRRGPDAQGLPGSPVQLHPVLLVRVERKPAPFVQDGATPWLKTTAHPPGPGLPEQAPIGVLAMSGRFEVDRD